ncbi:PPC domain-containing protein [Stenomitos frigidus]|uniref:Peptidase n=1 Tax=Stenomitos frigidus ULC18 TaxID=2107698 RepID=A0A2T1E077_9CYAN|nr:PPC domain-containing protein [Stenomitos frigidus]PSB26119.1 peptidase [Stenomitos frigidus ULC18]
MNHCSTAGLRLALLVPLMLVAVGMSALSANAQSAIYKPIPIASGKTITDKLTDKDLPTGQGGFARDYVLQLKEGDQLSIDLTSENFDTIVTLIGSDGSTVAENDDGPDGSTNSLLFTRITKAGTYFIRVRAFGELAGGNFKLKVTLLKPL